MTGKALIILVIGFTMIFLVMGYLWESVATRSVDNHTSYYINTIARNIAVSGANIALSEIKRDSNWVSDISGRDFEGGEMDVTITPLDSFRTLLSTGTFMDVEQTVRVKLQRAQRIFEEYAWFIPSVSTHSVNRPWITGDTVFGAFHSNKALVVAGDPVFFGKVTTLQGIADQAKKPDVSDPKFLGGYEDGISVTWDGDIQFPDHEALADEGVDQGGTCKFLNQNVWLTFNSDATVTYRTGPKSANGDSSKYSAPVTLPLTTMAPTGVIYLDGADIYLSGTLSGEVTVVADGAAGVGGPGNVYFVGDMTYATDPMIPNGSGGYMINPASSDLMGVMATNNVWIATSVESGGFANNVLNPDVHIDAGIFCVAGGFGTENLKFMSGPAGTMYLQGSMVAGMEDMISEYNNTTITKGYNRHVIFDSRFAVTPPSWFTYRTYYKIISWLE